MNLALKTHHIYWKRQTQRNSQIGKILWILRLRYLVKFLNVTSAWRCAINMEIKISVGFNFPMIEPESYFDANKFCHTKMYRFNGKLLQQTYTIYCMQAISTIFGVILSFFNNIISKTLITLHILCTCSSMGLQVAFRFSRIATSATCWTLAIAARSCKLILKFPDEIGVATKYRSWFETGSHIMNCQSPIKITMRRCSPFSVILQCVELQSYIWSNKQAINLAKLAAFIQDELILTEAERYVHQIINKETPAGLKKYMEVELFPCIHLKVGKGICLSTAW